MTNRQWQVTIALLALVLTSACGKTPTGPDPGPVTGTSTLTIKVSGNTGAATGAVSLFGPAPSTAMVATVSIVNELAVFSGLKPGDYRFSVVPTSFGDAAKENNPVSVSQSAVATEVALDRKWDIRFVDVSAGGQLLAPNDTVSVPTTLRFHYQIMNPEATARLTASVQAEVGFDTVIGQGVSAIVGPNLQDVAVDIGNFRACNAATGRCFSKSFRFAATVGPPTQPTVIQRDTDFSLNYR